MYSISNHIVCQAVYLESPNHDLRPIEDDLSLIVLHNISLPPGKYSTKYILDFFTNKLDYHVHPYFNEIKELKVSSHCLVARDGGLYQFVPFNKRAWHAGLSNYNGRERCNDFSIGIELEGSDYEEFTANQYQSLNQLIKILIETYPNLSYKHITGHSDIAPGRKTDPGPYFNWKCINTE